MAANIDPMIHDWVRTRAGLMPARSRRSGLSTTPRMATPVFENLKKEYSPMADTRATTMEIIWSVPRFTPAKPWVSTGRNCGKLIAAAPKMAVAVPDTMSSSPMVATILADGGASASPRAMRSVRIPATGATTNRTISAASGHDM